MTNDWMINMTMSIASIIGGGCLIMPGVKATLNGSNLSSKEKRRILVGILLVVSGITGLFVRIAAFVSSLLFGCLMFWYMYGQEIQWKGHRFTTAYMMHCSGWVLSICAILYGILQLIIICEDSNTHISGPYVCYESRTPICAIHNVQDGTKDIPPTVLDYTINGAYILVRQQPKVPQYEIYRHIDYPDYTPNAIYYWIIDTRTDSIIGSMGYNSFIDECNARIINDDRDS